MKPGAAVILILLFVPPVVSLFHLWNAAYSLYSHGKSKTRIKKLGNSMKTWHKLLLLYPLEKHSAHYRMINILRKLYYLVVLVFFGCILMLIISKVYPAFLDVFLYCVIIKFLMLDLPIGVFSFVMTKHGKSGGVVWKWEE